MNTEKTADVATAQDGSKPTLDQVTEAYKLLMEHFDMFFEASIKLPLAEIRERQLTFNCCHIRLDQHLIQNHREWLYRDQDAGEEDIESARQFDARNRANMPADLVTALVALESS